MTAPAGRGAALLIALSAFAAAAGERAARHFDEAAVQVVLPPGREAEVRACLAAARTTLAEAFNDHRSDPTLRAEARHAVLRCVEGAAPAAGPAEAQRAPVEAQPSPPAPPPAVEEASAAAPVTPASISAPPLEAGSPAEPADPALLRELLSWYLCQVCQPIVDRGVALRKAARRNAAGADASALADAERQIEGGTRCGKVAVEEFRKLKARPLACGASAVADVARCLGAEPTASDVRCQALQAQSRALPAAAQYAR